MHIKVNVILITVIFVLMGLYKLPSIIPGKNEKCDSMLKQEWAECKLNKYTGILMHMYWYVNENQLLQGRWCI